MLPSGGSRQDEDQEKSQKALWITPNTGPRPRHGHAQGQPPVLTPQPSALTFVNVTGRPIRDVKVQRQIRQHVMRDIGRGRRKPASPALQVLDSTPTTSGFSTPSSSSSASQGMSLHFDNETFRDQEADDAKDEFLNESASQDGGLDSSISRFSAGRIDPFVPWPVDLDARTQRLLDHLFTDPRTAIKFYLDGIFPIGLTGPASFYQILANLTEYLKQQPHSNAELRRYEEWEGLYYQGKAMELVKELLVKDPVSDELVAAMLGMACYSNIVQDFEAWRQHINGLQEIIRLRGGPDDLNLNPAIRISLSWIDINSSGTYDIPPHWPIPSHLPTCRPILPSASTVPPNLSPILSMLQTLIPSDHEIIAICSNTARFAVFLGAEVFRTSGLVYREAIFAGSIINTTLFQLLGLQTRPDACDNASLVVEAVRLALILWLAEVRRSFGIYPIISAVHMSKLIALLRMTRLDWGQANLVKLLILGVAIIEAVKEEDLWWLGKEWGVTARGMGFAEVGKAQKFDNYLGVSWKRPTNTAKPPDEENGDGKQNMPDRIDPYAFAKVTKAVPTSLRRWKGLTILKLRMFTSNPQAVDTELGRN